MYDMEASNISRSEQLKQLSQHTCTYTLAREILRLREEVKSLQETVIKLTKDNNTKEV
ncbi:coil containing protein [Vibrio phage 1.063.O._10N.261.45.C7]|nr:coil containing protein [Vibrio phage 1.063.O._10N.261.45.C7]